MSLGSAVGLAATAIPIGAAATVIDATRCIGGCGRKPKHMHGAVLEREIKRGKKKGRDGY